MKPCQHCKTIRDLMATTERGRKRDSVGVFITEDLWKRIYLNARKGCAKQKSRRAERGA